MPKRKSKKTLKKRKKKRYSTPFRPGVWVFNSDERHSTLKFPLQTVVDKLPPAVGTTFMQWSNKATLWSSQVVAVASRMLHAFIATHPVLAAPLLTNERLQTTCKQALLLVFGKAVRQENALVDFYLEYWWPLMEEAGLIWTDTHFEGYSQVFSYMATTMKTAFLNAEESLYWMGRWHDTIDWTGERGLCPLSSPLPSRPSLSLIRFIWNGGSPNSPGKVYSEDDLKTLCTFIQRIKTYQYMPAPLVFLQTLLMTVESLQLKTFPLFPLFDIKRHYVRLDAVVLASLLRPLGVSLERFLDALPKRRGKGAGGLRWTPTPSLQTDGVVCCIAYTKHVTFEDRYQESEALDAIAHHYTYVRQRHGHSGRALPPGPEHFPLPIRGHLHLTEKNASLYALGQDASWLIPERVRSYDPGLTDLLYSDHPNSLTEIREGRVGSQTKTVVSGNEWRRLSYVNVAQKRELRLRRQLGADELYAKASQQGSFCTGTESLWTARLRALFADWKRWVDVQIVDPRRARLRFQLHQHKQRAIASIARKVFTRFRDDQGRPRSILVMGDATLSSTPRGTVPAPRLRKALQAYGLVITVSETRTSMQCPTEGWTESSDPARWQPMKNRKDRTYQDVTALGKRQGQGPHPHPLHGQHVPSSKGTFVRAAYDDDGKPLPACLRIVSRKVHRVLHCPQCKHTWNRDASASRNIHARWISLFNGLSIPRVYSRSYRYP